MSLRLPRRPAPRSRSDRERVGADALQDRRGRAKEAAAPTASEPPISDEEFARFRTLIYRDAGIHLSAQKKALLTCRLMRRLKDLGLPSFTAYYRRVLEDDEEKVRMLDRISTNETHFFREPRQFEFLDQRVLPEWGRQAAVGKRTRKLRAWSAGCSTGEEPYSLAMSLLARFPPGSGWDIEILATDLSTRALDKAREAVWPLDKADEIPRHHLRAFMLQGTGPQEGKIKAGPEIRSLVRFERANLNEPTGPESGSFDLILCRNVLIYFDEASRRRALTRMLARLSPTGYLLVGHAESIVNLKLGLRLIAPLIYAPTSK